MGEQRGFNRVTDQVERRKAFSAANPHVHIAHRPGDRDWTAVWYDAGERHEISDPELAGLLDRLDWKLAR